MLRAAGGDAAQEFVEQARALLGQHGQQAEGTLLQRAVGIQQAGQFLLVGVENAGAEGRRAAGLFLQLDVLEEHLLGRGIERAGRASGPGA